MTISSPSSIGAHMASVNVTNRMLIVLVSSLFFLPSLVFATWLAPVPAIAVTLGCCVALAVIAGCVGHDRNRVSEAIHIPRLLVAIMLAIVILVLGGETHTFYATADWQIRDAVLSDLVRHGLTAYRVGDVDYLLRAPLGMYMGPALVGRFLGLYAAHLALLAQNALILGSIFYILTLIGGRYAQLAIVILFAGASVVGTALLFGKTRHDLPYLLRYGLDAWHPYMQYSSSMVQFFWVPNHALPGWWLATLLLLQRPSSPDVATVGVSVAGLAFWSPLAVIPAVPWLLYCIARHWRPTLLSRRTWFGAVASAGFVPILAYMVTASSSISHESAFARPDYAFWYMLFIAVQLPALVYLACEWREVPEDMRTTVVLSALLLLVLPLFNFGPSNDLVMRGSIAPLAIIAFVFGSVLVELTRQRAIGAIVGWILVVVTVPSALLEIGRSLSTPRYAISDCSLMEASRASGSTGIPTNYVAPVREVPEWLLDPSTVSVSPTSDRACWPDRVEPRFFGNMYKTVSKP